jgi:hypothetical protein
MRKDHIIYIFFLVTRETVEQARRVRGIQTRIEKRIKIRTGKSVRLDGPTHGRPPAHNERAVPEKEGYLEQVEAAKVPPSVAV